MDSIDLIRANLLRSEAIVLARIEDMREHSMIAPSSAGGCHTLWILGQVVRYVSSMLPILCRSLVDASGPIG